MFTRYLASARDWWRTHGNRYAAAQWRRLITGSVIGCLAAVFIHLLWRDAVFLPALKRAWAKSPIQTMFDGVSAYKVEVEALCAILAAAALTRVVPAIRRYVRAWWAGITSLTTVSSAILVTSLLRTRTLISESTIVSLLVAVTAFVCESWRLRAVGRLDNACRGLPVPPVPQKRTAVVSPDSWPSTSSDDPIHEWDQDIIGRSSVVEVLTEHIFVYRTPIVHLSGELGDGKSSVLNLLRQTIEGHAIIVSFSAWLPGSDQTLALDLFRDIATECRRAIYVPQVKKASLAYARTLSGSVSFLAGLKEVLPTQSQREEIDEIREVLGRVPLPIVVLLDEVDRMQRDELLVLLKILRGAASLPNVTFVCAFSEGEIRKRLAAENGLSNDYLEKFFPVSVNLAAPAPGMIGMLFQRRIMSLANAGHWFLGSNEKKFRELLEYAWEESLSRICTNLRKAGLLLNDLVTAARPIAGEVNAFDLICIESIRRFEPAIYRLVRNGSTFLANGGESWTRELFSDQKKNEAASFFSKLEECLSKSPEPSAIRILLELLFPNFASHKEARSRASFMRTTNDTQADQEKRVCAPDYFSIYFRTAVPTEMYAEAELSRFIVNMNGAKSEAERVQIFTEELRRMPAKQPKSEDFLWKIGLAIQPRLNDDAAEGLAYASAICAAEYAYDIVNIGEAARALNIVFEAAQKLSSTAKAEEVLIGAMNRAADDTFALRLLDFTEHRDRNKVLTDFTHLDPQKVRAVFFERMRRRYGKSVDAPNVNISRGDWVAFRAWADHSASDKETEQDFWRRFIGTNRNRLGQALNFLYPNGYSWSEDPRKIIDNCFPLEEAKRLLNSLKDGDSLDDVEVKAIARFEELLGGKWFNIENQHFGRG